MKRNIALVFMLLISPVLYAQTHVEKKIAAKNNNFGIVYSLPKTSLIVNSEVKKYTCKVGPYYKYAEKYLGVKDVVTEDGTYYELGKVSLINKGMPDELNTYVVEFKPGTVSPYVYLTKDGLLCTINAEYSAADLESNAVQGIPASSEYITPVLTEELLMAGSVARQAEVAARQIFHLRESKMDILTGDADNLPPDGEAMKLVIKQLEDQEKALTSLFVGVRNLETSYFDVSIVPQEDLDNEVIFRFSKKLGILDADDLGGEPVYMNLKATDRAPELNPKDAEKKEKSMKGIVYNVPGKARIEIKTSQTPLYRGEVQVVQFGTRENLAPVMFEDKKNPVKIYFYPETGAIKQLIQ